MLKLHVLSSTHPGLIATLSTMLEVDPKQRVSAREALIHLRKILSWGIFLPLGKDPEEQSIFEEEAEWIAEVREDFYRSDDGMQ